MKRYTLLLFSLICALSIYSQSEVTMPEPTMLVVNADGEETTFTVGEDGFSGEAPVTVKLYANAAEVEGYSMVCMWSFTKEGETEPYLVRHETDVEIVLNESGATYIQPIIIYTSKENSDIYWEFGTETYSPFTVVLAESSLEVPNAFSPNGDGINDYFNVYNVKSIISFSAAIYNRWGQQLYSWGIDEMECESCGWDGTYKGKPVRAGVYFVVVKAKGADGIEYEFKSDVNLLRGYFEEGGDE